MDNGNERKLRKTSSQQNPQSSPKLSIFNSGRRSLPDRSSTLSVSEKQKELAALLQIEELGLVTLEKFRDLLKEFSIMKESVEDVANVANNWDDIFRYSNLANNKANENGEPPVLVELGQNQEEP